MPSLMHEGLLEMIRQQPAIISDFLQGLFGLTVPRRLTETTFHRLVPVEYEADAVALFVAHEPVFGAIVEVQMRPDARKRFTWPHYAVAARAQYECPFVVVVLTADAATAAWAARPIELGGGAQFPIFAIGPEGIPVITDAAQATREPYLAVLSAMAHGRDELDRAVAVAAAAVVAIQQFPEDKVALYFALIRNALSEAARKAFEMLPETKEPLFLWDRNSYARGEAQGKADGKAEGKAQGEAEAVLRVLAKRGIAVPDAARERIRACRDLATLEQWLDRAVTAANIDELFAGG